MQYVVCYDISDDARRSRLANILLDFGSRAQESVFLAHLDEELASKMVERVRRCIEEHQDRVHIFALCDACVPKIQVLGTAELAAERDFYIL
ncbi:MAG: CRISPR-associated endonuclease Cas2 [Acidobacteria bacterium]|nr:CRISPR-associated endonuclease Cas2 [Acidobacteriota bacterium]